MLKIFFVSIPLSLAIGASVGYRISELERESLISKFNQQGYAIAATAPIPKPKPLTRSELETRFIACVGKPMRLQAFSDKDLNDSLAECEALKAQS
ncbi:hypothetical protein [Phormidium tenue]|uniref:Uncharacterized protein n=1 Tax=Phormidium tenue FACHB-1050 TaxID=2692857 RepID=A0ABR8CGZ2_9CYAN|nr:hypothetical protein [Phormidium tenue]MBD2319969.1 hypothetical protein [Phormidium tenue FACHB-1050]